MHWSHIAMVFTGRVGSVLKDCRGECVSLLEVTHTLCHAQVPGFVAFISAEDVPRSGSHDVFGDALFATDFADYAGQRIGLAVADSQVTPWQLDVRHSSYASLTIVCNLQPTQGGSQSSSHLSCCQSLRCM